MRHDRTGEPVDEDTPDPDPPHHCDRGWIDRDADQPRPCLVCKPWLSRATRAS
jgi:hypothetical protein